MQNEVFVKNRIRKVTDYTDSFKLVCIDSIDAATAFTADSLRTIFFGGSVTSPLRRFS